MKIREATKGDFEEIFAIFDEIVSAGETYPYPINTDKDSAYRIWMLDPKKTFVAVSGGKIVGTYYIKPNQPGLGSHVCNCGYMVSSKHRGEGIATQMCIHSQNIARELGYKAMQFNLVVSTNKTAVNLWGRLGFETIGRLAEAFAHPRLGYVDALVMYKKL